MWRKYFGKLGCLPPKRGSWKSTTLRTARRRTISSRSATTRKWCGRRLTKSDADSPNVRTGPTNAPGRLSAPVDDRPSNIRNTFTTTSAIIAPCKFRYFNCSIFHLGQPIDLTDNCLGLSFIRQRQLHGTSGSSLQEGSVVRPLQRLVQTAQALHQFLFVRRFVGQLS